MAKDVKPPEEQGAPAYMAQYTALMMLLLAFFIAMLAQCSFGPPLAGMQKGLGGIRNALGIQAGWGILPFMSQVDKTVRQIFPRTDQVKEEDRDRNLIAHPRQSMLRNAVIRDEWMSLTPLTRGKTLRVTTPIEFPEGQASLRASDMEYIERVGGVLQSDPSLGLVIRVLVPDAREPDAAELLAAQRAAVVARYLRDVSGVPSARIRAVGYAFDRYLGEVPAERTRSGQVVWFYIQKMQPAGAAAPAPPQAQGG